MAKNNIALVVLSTDAYADAWGLFFHNFCKYWSSFEGKKYLITDSIIYEGENVLTLTPKEGDYDGPMDWGGRLLSCIEGIEEDNLMIFLEDYILIKDVNSLEFEGAIEYFNSEKLGFLSLGTHDLNRRGHYNMTDSFVKVAKFSKYRVTTSPGLWKKEVLKKYLMRGLNPWQFEIIGTYISWLRKDSFYMLNKMKFNLNYEIIPYFIDNGLDSAIVRGKWQKKILKFSDEIYHEGIYKRGLLETYSISRIQTILKVVNRPFFVLRYILTVLFR